MRAVSKILVGGVAIAALASAAPAAAQYGYGYPSTGGVIGQVVNQMLGSNQYGYANQYGSGYGGNSQMAVQQCTAAVQQRLSRSSGYGSNAYGYGGYGGYANNGYGAGSGRVLGVTSVERRSNGLRVRGVATANGNSGYGGGYGSYGGYGGYGGYAPQQTGELTFKCNVDYRGYVSSVDINRNNSYGSNGYNGYNGQSYDNDRDSRDDQERQQDNNDRDD